ncbi:hypothetical protein [Streptomyces lydicus]|uniref:hypothetical protein n=1 Tax=Streptomyces lydicus TaxID=47763 RepID=UPI00100E8DF3|nr:hypothetical protein [Streptomyces lydicus]
MAQPSSDVHDAECLNEGLLRLVRTSPGPAEVAEDGSFGHAFDHDKPFGEQCGRGGVHVQAGHAQCLVTLGHRDRGDRSADALAVRLAPQHDQLFGVAGGDDVGA